MLENINYALFALLNATPASPHWAIEMAIFIAKDLILIVPLLVVTLWLWGPAQRQMVFKLMLALTISLTVSCAIGHLYPHDRPFVAGVGYNFLHQAADDSFPSDPGTVSFTFALAFPALASPVVPRPVEGHCRPPPLVPSLSPRAWTVVYGSAWLSGRYASLLWHGVYSVILSGPWVYSFLCLPPGSVLCFLFSYPQKGCDDRLETSASYRMTT
ncbi:unnamed protein product, partial [Klebsiella pneumoniae subsp. rhinoscleromatis SB3432]